MNKDWLRMARAWFFAQKYRFDVGLGFLVFLNFALLVLAASDKLKIIFGFEHISQLALFLLPLAFVCVWAFGFFLDTVVKAPSQSELESGRRSVLWKKTFSELGEIKQDLQELKKELKALKEK